MQLCLENELFEYKSFHLVFRYFLFDFIRKMKMFSYITCVKPLPRSEIFEISTIRFIIIGVLSN